LDDISNYVGWENLESENIFFDFTLNCYLVVDDYTTDLNVEQEEGFAAVKIGVPRRFDLALKDPVWGEAARSEWDTLTKSTRCIVDVDQEIAKQNIADGADCLSLIPVYEEKIKDGKLVRKVRLVANGKYHKQFGSTYAPTPSKDVLFILFHIWGHLNWSYYHVDENRAFVNAERQDKRNLYLTVKGICEIKEAAKALYGLKDAAADYRYTANKRLENIGFVHLMKCICVYIKRDGSNIVVVYDFVDDYIFSGNDENYVEQTIAIFRTMAPTGEPIKNSERILGYEIQRIPESRLILIRQVARIEDLEKRFSVKRRKIPMPKAGYVINSDQIDQLPEEQRRALTKEEIVIYMSIVGSLNYIKTARHDISFTVLYLSWYTRAPVQHHLNMAYYCIGYLIATKDMPLVLGSTQLRQTVCVDAAHASGPRCKSITGKSTDLGAGCISGESTAQSTIKLSSFESELDGMTSGFKQSSHIRNILYELGIDNMEVPTVINDNQAMINFVNGTASSKGTKHMEMRLWYTREQLQMNHVKLIYGLGETLKADGLTKLGTESVHRQHTINLQGLFLLENDYFSTSEYLGAVDLE
jgi:hypothetical protein